MYGPPTTIVLWNEQGSERLLSSYIYAHRIIHLSIHIEETFFFFGGIWWLTQRPHNWSTPREQKTGELSSELDISSNPPLSTYVPSSHPRLRDHRRTREAIHSRVEDVYSKQYLQGVMGSLCTWTHRGHSYTIKKGIKLVSKTSQHGWGDQGHEAHPSWYLAEPASVPFRNVIPERLSVLLSRVLHPSTYRQHWMGLGVLK